MSPFKDMEFPPTSYPKNRDVCSLKDMKFQLPHLCFCKGKISQVKQHNELSAQTAVSQQRREKSTAIFGTRLTLTH